MKHSTRAKTSDFDFWNEVEKLGASGYARKYKANLRNVYKRRENLERKYSRQIRSPDRRNTRLAEDHAAVLRYPIKDGVVLIGSDAHIWPGKPTTAMRAFAKFAKDYEPSIVILNGDVLDFPQVSRHPPIGHLQLPDLADEIEAAKEQLHVLELAVRRSCRLVWTLGNHDSRFETRLATVAPEYARLHGHSLKDHFPAWSACWRCDINDSVVVKHRFKGGDNAPFNNALRSGKTMVTGHLHSQKVTPLTDYNGDRWGVDTGCMADPHARAFIDYTEAGPLNWRSGFSVLTFREGKLLPPELVTVWDDKSVTFRGEIIKV
jgi:hypothetical protein